MTQGMLLPADGYWRKVPRTDPRARALADRHYSRQTVGARDFMASGRVLVMLTHCTNAVWVLLEYAKRERRWRHWDGESTKALTRIAELKAEEKKIKARTKSASRKDSNQAVRDEQARTEKMRFDLIQDARDLAALAARIEQRCRRKGTP